MIKLVTSTFPFIRGLHDGGHHVNDVCRAKDRTKDEDHCPFVFLSAFSFSNAMVLAMLAEFVENLLILNDYLNYVLRHLDKICEKSGDKGPEINPLVTERAKTALEKAKSLDKAADVLQIEHPFVGLFLDGINEYVKKKHRIDDIKLRFRCVIEELTAIGSPGYPREDSGEPEINVKNLSEQSEPFLAWLESSRDLRIGVGEYIWECRKRHLGVFEIAEDLQEKDKQRVFEIQLMQRVTNMATDEGCVFKVDVNGDKQEA